MVQTRGAATEAARAQSTRSGRVPRGRVDAQLQPAFGDRDVRLRSVAPAARQREAKRRLGDEDEPAGKAGRNNCRMTGPATAEYNKGKRPWAFSVRKVGEAANSLCEPVVRDAWEDPAHRAEERRLCGDRNWVYPYQRGSKRVRGHCRKLSGPQKQSMEVAAAKVARRKQERSLEKLLRGRDAAVVGSKAYQRLDREVKALRAQLRPRREPVLEEPDDISQYDFKVVRPGRAPATAPARPPEVITKSMHDFIATLPRGERAQARRIMTGYRNYGDMEPSRAIARYKQRKADDARTPLNDAGEFEDELGTDDESDSEPKGGALGPGLQNLYESEQFRSGHPALHARLHARSGPTGLSRADEIAQRTAALAAAGMSEQAAAAQELAERDQIAALANDPYNVAIGGVNASLAEWNAGEGRIMQQRDAEDAPDSPGGGALYREPLSQSFGGEGEGSWEAAQPGGGALDFPEVAEELQGQRRPYPWDERSPHATAMQQVNDGHIARAAHALWRSSRYAREQEADLPTDDPDTNFQTTVYDRRNYANARNALERHRRDATRMQRDMEAHQGPYGTFEGSAMQETLSGGAAVP
jgi:hypothetical protein